jgi:hypothetical protein
MDPDVQGRPHVSSIISSHGKHRPPGAVDDRDVSRTTAVVGLGPIRKAVDGLRQRVVHVPGGDLPEGQAALARPARA